MRRRFPRWFAAAALVAALSGTGLAQQVRPGILAYIRQTWSVLTRSNRTLAVAAADPKTKPLANGKWPVYISRAADRAAIEQQLQREMDGSDWRKVELRRLPRGEVKQPGLLYLPYPYVVPGGRFNEMYGWDSYFIQLGLLRDGEAGLARGMADNFLYEIRQYGRILNANRTYYLTRSQPPFLTEMVLGVFLKTGDRQWLADAVPAMERYYRYWTSSPHEIRETGLSRYFDLGTGPAPEVVASEKDEKGRTHYDRVREYFKTHNVADYDVSQYYNRKRDRLTELFYKGDRSMRESGFDPSNRFGPFSVDIIHYNPVGLNVLLYQMESQMGDIAEILGQDPALWREKAKARAAAINKYMWDDAAGFYFDYQVIEQKRRVYPFLTTFYPLWAGIASQAQAKKIVANLPKFERDGGLMTSTVESGSQWDAPFGWAPLQLIAVQGLRRYGFDAEADRIAMKWLSLVRDDYRRTGRIVEKYDVVKRASDVSGSLQFGYSSNEAGFGWTNGVFTALLDGLHPGQQAEILAAE